MNEALHTAILAALMSSSDGIEAVKQGIGEAEVAEAIERARHQMRAVQLDFISRTPEQEVASALRALLEERLAHIEVTKTMLDLRSDDPHACTVKVIAGMSASGALLAKRTERGNLANCSRSAWAAAVAARFGRALESDNAAERRYLLRSH